MKTPLWWQTAVLYQIYPRSFQDTDGDGVGDLRGITQRLPYLKDLGIDAIWLSPVFPSPMADFGYDVSDFTDIDPLFGSMADFDRLLESAHSLGLKLVLDFVPNHTSNKHPWFEQSRSSRNDPKRGWYIWRDPGPAGKPPNNWLSNFGGSAWEYDSRTGQYYYHAYLAAQPDLNWRNPEVRDAMYEVMRFWLRRGVDGFRVDVLWHVIKDDKFRDNPPNPAFREGEPPHHAIIPLYTADRPEIHDVIAEMRRVTDEFGERVLIGEIYLPIERLVAYYGRDLRGVHLPFNFSLIRAPWHARSLAKLIEEYEAALPPGGWPNWVLSNHDNPRIGSRIGREQLRVAAMLLMTLRGTPTIYYGEEIGMEQVQVAGEALRDPFEKNVPGLGLGRDGCRTPMQWDDTPNAGFSRTTPWLPVSESFIRLNVEAQRCEENSLYSLYHQLISLRRSMPALASGSYRPVAATGELLTYVRAHGTEQLLIALNLGNQPLSAALPEDELRGRIILSTFQERSNEPVEGTIDLRPNEGIVIEVKMSRAVGNSEQRATGFLNASA
jgi:alpha-glucosidase